MPSNLEDWAQPIKDHSAFANQLKSQLSARSSLDSGEDNAVKSKLPSYIGTKVVQAEPMTDLAFQQTYKGKGLVSSERAEDAPGYLVVYEDGYKSWSPRDVFERSYRRITDAEKQLIK